MAGSNLHANFSDDDASEESDSHEQQTLPVIAKAKIKNEKGALAEQVVVGNDQN